ncbi:hypothetical protein IFR05_016539 [Cadophora sp. M221]|nr:hypothetical protein IFR05_016539 [Cadophora sp. M221]
MATVDLNHVQFWQPPKPSLHQQHTLPRKHSRAASATTSRNQPVAATQQRGGNSGAQPEDEEIEAQELAGCIRNPTNYNDDTDDSLPSIEELLDPLLRKEIAATGCQGTRDRPVILEEDEGDTPDRTADSETTSTSTSANTSPVPAFELSQRADPSNREPWWDVEESCFVYEDMNPLPSLDHEGLASPPAQDQPPSRRQSLGVSQDQTKPHGDNRTTRIALEESAAQSFVISLDQDGGGDSKENVSDLERDMQVAFEEQEELLATSPSSPLCRSFESSHPTIDQDCDRGLSEELRSSTRLCSQEKEREGPREQEQEEMAADEIMQEVVEQELEEADDDDDSGEREQRGEKRQYQDRGINTGIHHSESSGHGYDTKDDGDEDDEEDENPRPTKQRRLFPASPDVPPTPPLEQSSQRPCLARPHNVKSSSTTQVEIGNAQSRTDLAHPPTSVNNDHHYTPPSSRSPSDTEESASGAEFHEWPLQGFLKRVTIGDQITYNLEFSLSHVPKHLSLSLHSEVSSTSSRESSVEAAVSRRAVTSRKPGIALTKNQERLLAKMVRDDKTWAEIGRRSRPHTAVAEGQLLHEARGEASEAGTKAWCEG